MPLVADLSFGIAAVGTIYTLTRVTPASPEFTDGLPTPATTATFDVVASVQPLSGQQLRQRPELRDMAGAMRLFTGTVLQTLPPDRFTYAGAEYEVTQLLNWQDIGGFGEYVITRREAR